MNLLEKYKNMSKQEFIKKEWPKDSVEQSFKEFLIAGNIMNKFIKENIINKESKIK